MSTYSLPSQVLISPKFFDRNSTEGTLEGEVAAIIHDSDGYMYCAFEMADKGGMFLIHCGSNFFKGFKNG